MTKLDPNDFIITRKRKKYKFAKFANADNCFEFEEWQKRPVDVLEIGAGTGLFSVELAKLSPDKTFVAIDVKADRLQKGAYRALDEKVHNVSFLRARADQIDELFPAESLAQIWITFSDPFPRERSEKRRLTHPIYLAKYQKLLKPDGKLILKHDSKKLFDWSQQQLESSGWKIEETTYDLHASNLPESYKIMTTYEERWVGEGAKINLLTAKKVK